MLGNLDAKRDWGYAPEYCKGMWRILQHSEADDFVLATGESHTVRYFVEQAFSYLGIGIGWNGSGVNEKGVITAIDRSVLANRLPDGEHFIGVGDQVLEVSPTYYRPTEVDSLIGDASKAERILGWKAETHCNRLIEIMMAADLESLR